MCVQLVILQDVSELQQWVDPDQLPVEYSGTNTYVSTSMTVI